MPETDQQPEFKLAASLREQIPQELASVKVKEDEWYEGSYTVRLHTASRKLHSEVLESLSQHNCSVEYLNPSDQGHDHKWIIQEQ